MNVAEWILVVILSVTLLVFLILGIVLVVGLIGVTKEAKKVIVKSQDIADNANGIVSNVKGMTSIGGVVQTFVDKYVEPKVKEKKKPVNDAASLFRKFFQRLRSGFFFISRQCPVRLQKPVHRDPTPAPDRVGAHA